MEFEYEIRLKDGRTVFVTGEADISYACDCGGEGHTHIDSLDIDSAVLIVNDGEDQWLEIERGGKVLTEIEDKVCDRIYAEMPEAV